MTKLIIQFKDGHTQEFDNVTTESQDLDLAMSNKEDVFVIKGIEIKISEIDGKQSFELCPQTVF